MRSEREETITAHGVGKGRRPSPATMNMRAVAYFAILALVVGLAGGLYLDKQSQVDAYARRAYELHLRKAELRRELSNLRAEAASLGSLQRVYRMGSTEGYELVGAADAERHVEVAVTSASLEQPGAGKGLWDSVAHTLGKVREGVGTWLGDLFDGQATSDGSQ